MIRSAAIARRFRSRNATATALRLLVVFLIGVGPLSPIACQQSEREEAMEEIEDEVDDVKEEIEDEVDDHT